MKKIMWILGFLGFVLFVNFAFAASNNFAGQTNGVGTSQYYQPSFSNYYSSEQISTYWPILDSMKNGQCQASNDFLVAIPPLGCTPTVVRSDLLEEQNVPVFCQLDALQVNPLIKVSSIESISFKGDYPSNVAGISFHPARAAVNTRENLLGSPLLNNIGYVVIILKRTPAEKDMPELVKGNLTATIRYDAEEAFGVGQAEFLLPLISDENWSEEYKSYGFWNGKGYVRLLSTDGETAEIGLYTDESRLLQKVNLKKGETSNEVFFPGLYCNAGLQVRLNALDAAVDKVKLSVGDEVVWATKGTKFLNGKCQVKSLIPSADGTGSVSIYCPGSSTFNLILSRWGALFNGETKEVGKLIEKGAVAKEDWYLAYVGNLSSKIIPKDKETEFAILVKSDKELDAKYLARAVSAVNLLGTSATKFTFEDFKDKLISKLGKKESVKVVLKGENGFEGLASTKEDKSLEGQVNVQGNFTAAKEAWESALDKFSNEQDLAGSEYAKKALVEYARAAGELGQYKSQREALEMLIEKYPASLEARSAETQIEVLGKFDITNAGKGVYVNNKYSYILAEEFKPVTSDIKNVDFNIKDGVGEGDEICVSGAVKTNISNCPFILVKKITPTYVDLTFADNVKGKYSNKSVRLYGDSTSEKNSEVLGGVTVYVRDINVEEEVSVSILPRVDNTKTEANFTFNIGIEKRSIQLSPAKTEEMIKNLNKSINDWQERVDKLGKLVTAWKGACFATSAFMVMSNFASGLSGESIARKNVMEKYKLICQEKVAQRTYSTLSECYNAMSTQIDDAVKTGTASVGAFNEKAKAIEKNSMMSDGKTINQTLLKNNLISEYSASLPASAKDMTTEQIKEYLFWKDQEAKGDAKLKEQAIAQMTTLDSAAKEYGTLKEEDDRGIVPLTSSTQLRTLRQGTAVSEAATKLKAAGIAIGPNQQVQVVSGSANQKYYVIIENESAASNRFVAKQVYAVSADGVVNPENLVGKTSTTADKDLTAQIRDATDIGSIRFVNSSCENPYKNSPVVKYYTVGVDKYLPSLVPFDEKKGWFVKVSQAGGGILSSNTNAYQASGAVSTYTVCNIGPNGLEENGLGDDICQTFYENNAVDEFGGCYGMTRSEVTNLKNRAQRAIQEAANQYGKTEVIINGQKFGSILASASDDGLGCYQFMSPTQCKTLFNVCDPVICPPSRCNLGGKYPVSNVIQSGIIGSLLLCLPNAREGIYVPICLTGVHAGLETYLSILKSEKACLQENLDSGKNVGICDEITSVYKCEFFWNQIAPIASSLVPTMFEMASGQKAARGGAEYMSVKSSWENMQGSIDYFKNSYAQNSFNAFKFKNIQEVGSEFCRANLGTSVPGGADLADGLLAPESPYQFYANFDESVFSDATLPSTSQYKVYYHIFAGNDQGVRYSVYLQNPPDSAYYHSNPIVTVKTGYVTKGESADEAIDFTAPSGYKELCVMINAKTECGFKTVSTSMAANYLTDKYVADQAKQTDVASEKECISGSPSVLAFATSPNLQAGAQGAVNPDVSLNGIVRVCATTNPGKTTNPDRWKQVGNCGNEKMLCWLDTKSVNETVSRVDAIEGITLSDAEKATTNLESNTKESYATVATKLVKLGDEIKAWKKDSDSSAIVAGLSEIIDGSGASNNQLANALYLKTIFHLNVVKAIKVETAQVAAKPTPGVSTVMAEVVGYDTIISDGSKTLAEISKKWGVNSNEVKALNPEIFTKSFLANPNALVPAGSLKIPRLEDTSSSTSMPVENKFEIKENKLSSNLLKKRGFLYENGQKLKYYFEEQESSEGYIIKEDAFLSLNGKEIATISLGDITYSKDVSSDFAAIWKRLVSFCDDNSNSLVYQGVEYCDDISDKLNTEIVSISDMFDETTESSNVKINSVPVSVTSP